MTKQESSEDEQLAGIRSGCKEAFRCMFDREASRLFGSIRAQGHSCLRDDDIDEVVADAFRVLWRAIDQGVAEDFDPMRYLRWIAKKRVNSRIRLSSGPKAMLNRTTAVTLPEPSDHRLMPPLDRLLTQERQAVLDAAMAKLTQRELLAIQWCRDHQPPGWTTFEEETGITAKTGRKLATAARKKLGEALKQYDNVTEQKGEKANDNRTQQTA